MATIASASLRLLKAYATFAASSGFWAISFAACATGSGLDVSSTLDCPVLISNIPVLPVAIVTVSPFAKVKVAVPIETFTMMVVPSNEIVSKLPRIPMVVVPAEICTF